MLMNRNITRNNSVVGLCFLEYHNVFMLLYYDTQLLIKLSCFVVVVFYMINWLVWTYPLFYKFSENNLPILQRLKNLSGCKGIISCSSFQHLIPYKTHKQNRHRNKDIFLFWLSSRYKLLESSLWCHTCWTDYRWYNNWTWSLQSSRIEK